MHINGVPDCPSCLIKLKTAEPRMAIFFSVVREMFLGAHVAVSFRDQADQHLAFLSGKSLKDWPESLHNNMIDGAPQSLALDLFRLGDDGRAYFEKDYYKRVWEYYLANKDKFNGIEVVWGGSWEHFKDYDHFQLEVLGV